MQSVLYIGQTRTKLMTHTENTKKLCKMQVKYFDGDKIKININIKKRNERQKNTQSKELLIKCMLYRQFVNIYTSLSSLLVFILAVSVGS